MYHRGIGWDQVSMDVIIRRDSCKPMQRRDVTEGVYWGFMDNLWQWHRHDRD